MRWAVFVILQGLILAVLLMIFSSHTEHVIALKRPPASIGQWYKPDNKRQVWLHTMFKLRREMQALRLYAEEKDAANLSKWAASFSKDYRKMAEMVPQWEGRLNLDALEDFEEAVAEHDYAEVKSELGELGQSCKSCHKDFRAVTATLYRAPDFATIKIDGSPSYNDFMNSLSEQVNFIKIGYGDGNDAAARAAFNKLSAGMDTLGQTCINCHKRPEMPYPDDGLKQALASLDSALETGTTKDKGRALGTLAVLACARCHSTHRLSGDARKLFSKHKSIGELLDHSY